MEQQRDLAKAVQVSVECGGASVRLSCYKAHTCTHTHTYTYVLERSHRHVHVHTPRPVHHNEQTQIHMHAQGLVVKPGHWKSQPLTDEISLLDCIRIINE